VPQGGYITQYENHTSVKHNYFIVRKVSYTKSLRVSSRRPSSGEVNINDIKEGMIKLREVSVLPKRIEYTLVGSSVFQYFFSVCRLTNRLRS
jgi:hypothetical protein